MHSDKAIQTLNTLLSGQLEHGITTDLVRHIRGGHAPYINQKTWLILAAFLEAGCTRPANRPPAGKSDEIRIRNHTIKQEYRQLRGQGISQKKAYGILADKYKRGERTIHGIITSK